MDKVAKLLNRMVEDGEWLRLQEKFDEA